MQLEQIKKELQAIRALSAEALKRTSRLEEKLVPVQGRATRKGLTSTEKAILRRNKRIGRA